MDVPAGPHPQGLLMPVHRLVLVALALGVTSCSGAKSTTGSLAGTYAVDHPIRVADGGDWTTEAVTDRLALVERGDSLDLSVVLLFDNYHICEVHTTMAPEGALWTSALPTDPTAEATTCTLQLEVGAATLSIRDPGDACRLTFCGARGTLEGATFDRSTRTADTSWRDALR